MKGPASDHVFNVNHEQYQARRVTSSKQSRHLQTIFSYSEKVCKKSRSVWPCPRPQRWRDCLPARSHLSPCPSLPQCIAQESKATVHWGGGAWGRGGKQRIQKWKGHNSRLIYLHHWHVLTLYKKQARFSRLARKLKRRRGLFSFSEPLPFEQFRFSAGSKARRPGSAALAAASSVTFSPHDSPRKVTPRTPSVLYYQLGFQCQEWGPWLPLSAPDTGRHSVHADRWCRLTLRGSDSCVGAFTVKSWLEDRFH